MIERNLIYAPNKQLLLNPNNIGLDFEDVRINTSDGLSLHGWYIPGPNKLTLVWFHGNSGNISTRLDSIGDVRKNLGYNIFIFDYRGYGLSSGDTSEEGTYSDSDAVMSYLLSSKDLEPSQTVLWGHSLGCAIATRVATKYPNISKEFFAKKGIQVESIKLNGSMELAPSLNMCRRIVDLVSTGKTLKENGLVEVEEIMKVQSKIIINRSAFKTNTIRLQKIIDEFKNIIS